ncbi:carboxypeptidase-like regulatory domain-containing protein [Paramicrobacterium chengjingii]|uniref:Carboxypeptidase regulatory-like domain-containing protein n=1 Tax=Paramicrobacterium chengjingii TaxID=2769067 RepID=A0ABX6YLE8_9MICO|nr:carboxypeptidase-like regulatory domain-containing protein [Microbacterium chengjingii]QPZ39167.1 carboxypeptidase regulatory-like domain-containing protein [Microbacterium chengjingii]
MKELRLKRVPVVLGALIGLSVLPLTSVPASAAPSDGYATWGVEGASGSFTGTVGFPEGFPQATFESDSLASATMVPSGSSTWIPDSTTFGAEFGSSRDKPYISLRPAANRAGAPSTTTYSFDTPTPAEGWGFSLGDIDAEIITVTATDATGAPVSAENLNLVEAFNYCGQTGSPSCVSPPPAFGVPDISQTATSYTMQNLDCPQAQDECDTAGASAWFMPSVPLASLTVTAEWKSGFPTYQTWFATVTRAVSGSVVADCVQNGPVDVQLLDAEGSVVASTGVESDGSFGFPQVAARSDYAVRVDPDSLIPGSTSPPVPVDVSETDVTEALLNISSSFTVSGTVAGEPSAEALNVSLTSAEGDEPAIETVTNASGQFSFADVARGDYELRVTPPANAAVSPETQLVTVNCAAPSPIAFHLTDTTPTDPTDPTDPPGVTDPTDGSSTPREPNSSDQEILPVTGVESTTVHGLLTAAVLSICLGGVGSLASAVRSRRRSR